MEETTPRHAQDQLEEIGAADLLVGILDARTQHAAGRESSSTAETTRGAAMLQEAVGKLRGPPRTVVVDSSLADRAFPGAAAPNGSENGSVAPAGRSFTVLPASVLGSDPNSSAQGISATYRRIFALGQQLEAKACCIVASNLDTVTPRWFYWLTRPVLEFGYDLVTPCYVHGPFEGLLNASIISPLHCALYGHNLQNPMGPDVGLSSQAVQRISSNPKAAEFPLVSLVPGVTGAGLKVCQAYVGRRLYPPTDWSALSSLLPPILSPVFAEIERNAAIWQRVRGVRPVNAFGDVEESGIEMEPVDTSRMIESFQLGIRDLREIWSLVLPPSTLLELTKLARLGPEQFRMPDPLWARIIYDFAASYRLRTLNRDHLLQALTPLYLGWVASYALELQAGGSEAPAGAREVQVRPGSGPSPLARLASAFEAVKPYFVSRWRWPDRFNP